MSLLTNLILGGRFPTRRFESYVSYEQKNDAGGKNIHLRLRHLIFALSAQNMMLLDKALISPFLLLHTYDKKVYPLFLNCMGE